MRTPLPWLTMTDAGTGADTTASSAARTPTDEQLLAAHLGGDPRAFGHLVRRHQNYLWAVARRSSHNAEDASDALQEALLKAHRNAATFRADAQVRSWLHRIVVNCALDRVRHNTLRHTVPIPEFDIPALADPRDATAEIDTRLAVDRALATLPADQREAVVAVDVEGYSVTDAAAILGVPTGTIKSRCARGRAKLAVALGHLREPDDVPPGGNPSIPVGV